MQIKRTIRRPELLKKTGLSATTIYYMERRGEFPKHFMLTPRCAVWDEAEIDAWLESRKGRPMQALDANLRRAAATRRVTF